MFNSCDYIFIDSKKTKINLKIKALKFSYEFSYSLRILILSIEANYVIYRKLNV